MQLAEQRDSLRIQLKGSVGAHEFLTALDRVAAGSDPVLDFFEATHIDYRAARDFAQQLRRARRQVRVVGLDDHCARILRFAWTVEDWERLQVAVTQAEPDASRLPAGGESSLAGKGDPSSPETGADRAAGAVVTGEMQVCADFPGDATTESLALWETMATWASGDWETVWSCS